jgi:wobble nucleotide-excising tRNase
MVVVIDDPVPSLDSGVLFIVTTLICDLFLNEHEFTHIKQFFILTHNIYFYKSVSQGKRGNPLPDATYYLVKKHDNETYIEYHKKNPIKGSYELLWQEIKGPQRNNSTIQNTMRCIFEN